jgi:hypothetical protein
MVRIAVVNSSAIVNCQKDKGVSCWFKPEKEICSQSDLSDKALYL